MNLQRCLGPVAALVLFAACGDVSTAPQPLDVGPAFDIVGQGQGAIVDHFSDETLVLLTVDPEAGLYSAHYTDSDQVAAFVGCPVPEFHGALDAVRALLPTDKQHIQGSGETYVIVGELAGFPANVCDEPVAEGTIRLHLSVNEVPGDSPGVNDANFGSNGVITLNADGSAVRLHHARHSLNDVTGTISLR